MHVLLAHHWHTVPIMTLPTSQALGHALTAAGFTPTEIGRAIVPGSAPNSQYKAGARLLSGSHPTDVDRLGELARSLRLTVTVSQHGVTVTRSV